MKSSLLGVVGLCVGLWASEASAFDPVCRWGANAHQASNEHLELAAAAGIAWVRFDMNWDQFEPSKGEFNWYESDRFVAKAKELGQHVFFTVGYSPAWAVAVPCNNQDGNPDNWCLNESPASVADWTEFLTAAVQRYGADVKHWGMWNEPNLGLFYQGSRDQYVNDILVPGSAAVHAACADCKVLGPELANMREATWDADEGQCVFGECAFNGWNHSLKEILKVAAGSIDIISHHKYYDPASGFWKSACDGDFQIIQLVNGLKEITDEFAPGKPVWITEFGWESFPPADPAYSAQQLTTVFTDMMMVKAGTHPTAVNQPWPELENMFWYDLNSDTYGLVGSDLVPTAPYAAYQQIIQTYGCPAPGAGGGGGAGPGASSSSGGGGEGQSASSGSPASGAGAGATSGEPSGPSGPGAGSGGEGSDDSGAGAGSSADPGDAGADDGGCGCRTAPSRGLPTGASLLVLALVYLARVRRRR